MKTGRLILLNIIILIILVGGGFAAYSYYNNTVNYISTENAQIAGQQVTISAPASGKLTKWDAKVGDHFAKDEQIGSVITAATGAGTAPAEIKITLPSDGTVVQTSAVKDSFVAAGMPLAQMFDLENLWVTANIEETSIDEMAIDQEVDIYVDAFPNTTLKGRVENIGLATSGTFSLLPNTNAAGNYTKVTQVIPVKIAIEDYKGLQLVPGMNVTVRVHK